MNYYIIDKIGRHLPATNQSQLIDILHITRGVLNNSIAITNTLINLEYHNDEYINISKLV